jgi:hypothetical protein
VKTILWQSSQHGYEEGYSIEIWRENNKYYMRTRGNNVMVGDYDDTEEVTADEALEIMLEEVENEDSEGFP